jgi:hypothetical protein
MEWNCLGILLRIGTVIIFGTARAYGMERASGKYQEGLLSSSYSLPFIPNLYFTKD